MLETIREYAVEKLAESGRERIARAQHADYFLAFAETAEPQLNGPEQQTWLDRMDREHDNLRSALNWRLHNGTPDDKAARMGGALWRFWFRRGYLGEGRRRMEELLRIYDPVRDASEDPEARGKLDVRARLCHGAGVLAFEQGDYMRAQQLYEESAALRRRIGDRTGLFASLNNMGNVALFRNDYSRAASLYAESLSTARELEDRWGTAMALGNMGWVGLSQGDYSLAMRYYEESLSLHRQAENKWGVTKALGSMGWAALYGGDYARAAALAEECLALSEELADKDTISDMLDILGRAAMEQGDYEKAASFLGKSLALSRDLGDRAGLAICLAAHASLATARREGKRAATLFGCADALHEATSDFQRAYFTRHIAAAKALLSRANWDAAHSTGLAMDLDRAIAYALSESAPAEPTRR